MILGFGNNVVSALAADITTIQTDIPVMPGTGAKFEKLLCADFDNKSNEQRIYAKITLTDSKESAFEICHLVSVSGDVLKVIRGQEGTTAKGWSLNDVVANFATRGSENYFVQIAQLQSGHYIAGVAGGTANALTLELPATFFVNGGTDWTLRTPLIIYPIQNNTGSATLQLTMGGRVLGIFPLYKGNQSELEADDIIGGMPLICVLDYAKSFFAVLNPLDIYLGARYLLKDQNGNDIPEKDAFVRNIGACRAFSGSVNIGGDNGNWTTAQFIEWLESQGAFNHPYWMCKGSWYYAGNKIITDTGCGNIQLAGAVVEVMGTKSAMTIRVTTPTTAPNGTPGAQFTYINHGDGYSPGWRRDWNRGGDTMTGELITTSQNALRMIAGNYGVILRQDGSSLYLLVTASGDQYGSWSSLRPFYFNLSTGKVTMGHSLDVTGTVTPTDYSNFDERYLQSSAGIQGIRLGSVSSYTPSGNEVSWTKNLGDGNVLTGIIVQDTGKNSADNIGGIYYRRLQYCVNGTWLNASST